MVTIEDYNIISAHILRETGIVIPESNINAVIRFLQSRRDQLNLSILSYIDKLKIDEYEKHLLIQVVTINETYFFREEKYFKLLNEKIFPELKAENIYPPVVWSGAASTGEEAISLSLLINKFWKVPNIHYKPVIATDIDVHSMNKINENYYSPNSMRDDGKVFHELIHNYSSNKNGNIVIDKRILDSISTKKLNLINDDFKPVFDTTPKIIFLCNVLIYMEPKIREIIINKAVEILDHNGYLFVSSSNTASIEHKDLELIQDGRSFYFKKKGK